MLSWGELTDRKFERGVQKGVLNVHGADNGIVAWDGLTAFSPKPEGGELNEKYADDIIYAVIPSAEKMKASISCFAYPDEFEMCNGSATMKSGKPTMTPGVYMHGQSRAQFDFSCRTTIGNGESLEAGYKLHLLWNAYAQPAEREFKTLDDGSDIIVFTFEVSAVGAPTTGYKPCAYMSLDSTVIGAEKMKKVEDMLYGSTGTPKFPSPDEVLTVIATGAET